jgi:hypothetical protein
MCIAARVQKQLRARNVSTLLEQQTERLEIGALADKDRMRNNTLINQSQ